MRTHEQLSGKHEREKEREREREKTPGDTQPGLGGFKGMGITTNPKEKEEKGGEASCKLTGLNKN